MSDDLDKLQQELVDMRRALAEAELNCSCQDAEHQDVIKELEDARKNIEQAHQEWIAALDAVKNPIFLHDKEFRILRCNLAYQQCAGIPFKQIIGQPYYDVFPKTHALLRQSLRSIENSAVADEEEVRVGEIIYRSRSYTVKDHQGAYLCSLLIFEDITESKRYEQIILNEKMFSDTLVNSLPDIFFLLDRQGDLLRWNTNFMELSGMSPEEMSTANALAFIHEEDKPLITQKIQQIFETGSAPAEARLVLKNGIRHYTLLGTRIETQLGANLIGFGIDITKRKQAEDELRESEKRYRTLFETMLNGFAYCRMLFEDGRPSDFIYLDVNEAFVRQTGLKDVVGRRVTEVIPGIREADPELIERYGRVAAGGKPEEFEIYVESLGMWFLICVYSPRPEHFVVIFDVITERKQTEIALRRANRALAALSEVNSCLVHATDEPELLLAVCRAIVRQSGYRMAWVGYLEQDEAKTIRVVAKDGVDEGYLENARLTWADTERGRGPSDTAARSGQTQVIQNFLTDERILPWRKEATKRGLASSVALPLINEGKVFGVLTIYAEQADAFNPEETSLLEQMAVDLAFGVRSLHTLHERDQALLQIQTHLAKLEGNLEDTIKAIAAMVEMRDPYTAGHEKRVAELAVAIARQMGLPEEQVHGIHLAGEVHDLGKIQIPAEILSKPSRLTEIEYRLIKAHPQAGYDILKGIDFTWPIAQMVLQHHERIDGSGYPQGFKGNAILLEARILCVADVVEAMASHRPYRPALGIEAALNEIKRGKGTLYDPAAADACLKVFGEGLFKF